MIFAKIDFINLLPFYTYIKKKISSTQIKQIINYKKSYPSAINKKFKKRQIDAAFISSIASRNKNTVDLGIVAKKDVFSVLAIKGKFEADYQSNTSNVLAQILNIQGKIIIGDKALQYYHNNPKDNFIDLAEFWQDKYNLPFVFARLSFNKHKTYITKLANNFKKTKVKIPQYILKDCSKKSGLSCKQINDYLLKISYDISYKEKRSLKLFFKLAKQKGL